MYKHIIRNISFQKLRYNARYRMLIFIMCCMILLAYIKSVLLKSNEIVKTPKPFKKEENLEESSEFIEIEKEHRILKLNSITTEVLKPANNKNIFFIMDAVTESGRKKLSYRDVCSIEAAVNKNPQYLAFITYLTFNEIVELEVTKSFYGLPYRNLRIVKINIPEFLAQSPWSDLATKKYFKKLDFQQLSQLFQLILLWKYGGIFISNEFVMKKSIEHHTSFFCGDDGYTIFDNIMKFEDTKILEMFVNSTIENLGEENWKDQFSTFVTKSINLLCKSQSNGEKEIRNCYGFDLMPKEFCKPLSDDNQKELFMPKSKDKILGRVNHSSFVHLWSPKTRDFKVNKALGTAAVEIMKNSCPNLFAIERKSEF